MRIFSQNLTNYDISLPKNSIFQINLACVLINNHFQNPLRVNLKNNGIKKDEVS
jgi:hypothetical protein